MMNQADDNTPETIQRRLAVESRRADRYRYVAHMLQMPFLWEKGRSDLMRNLLDQTPHLEDDFAWGYWRYRTTPDTLVLRGPDRRFNAVDFSSDGRRAIVGYESGRVVVWDLVARQAVCNLHPASGTSLSASNSEELHCAVLTPEQVPSDAGLAYVMSKSYAAVHGVGFLPDDNRVWTLTYGGDLVLWRADSGECLSAADSRSALSIHAVEVAARSPDRRYAVFGGYFGQAWIVDLLRGTVLHTLEGHGQCVSAAAWSPDGARVATGSWDHQVKVWDAASGRELHSQGFPYRIQAVALDRQQDAGICIVQGNSETGPTLHIWDLATGERKFEEPLPRYSAGYLAISADGRKLAVSGYETTRIWDLPRCVWEEAYHLPEGRSAFSPDGRRLLVKEQVQTLRTMPRAKLAFPPGEAVQILRSGSLSSGRQDSVQYLGYRSQGVSPLVVSPDGRHLAGG